MNIYPHYAPDAIAEQQLIELSRAMREAETQADFADASFWEGSDDE